MTAYVKHNTGETWDEIENNMTIPRLQALEKVWETSPPIARSISWIAQSRGMKLKRPRKETKEQSKEFMDVLKTGGGFNVG